MNCGAVSSTDPRRHFSEPPPKPLLIQLVCLEHTVRLLHEALRRTEPKHNGIAVFYPKYTLPFQRKHHKHKHVSKIGSSLLHFINRRILGGVFVAFVVVFSHHIDLF